MNDPNEYIMRLLQQRNEVLVAEAADTDSKSVEGSAVYAELELNCLCIENLRSQSS